MSRKISTMLLCLPVIFLCLSKSFSAETVNALPFLRMTVGARALSCGGAFTAVSDDATAIYSNPAGLSLSDGLEITSMYSVLSLDRSLNILAIAKSFEFGSLGLGIINSGVSGINAYNDDGVPEGSFSYQANGIILSYARSVHENTSVGVNLKTIFDSLKDNSRTGFGLDIGLLSKVRENLSLGLKIQDIINVIDKDSAPLIITLGGAYKLTDELTLSADVVNNFEFRDTKLKLGAAYKVMDTLSIGAGLNDTEASFGLGFSISKFNLWYAFATDKLKATNSHFVSLGVKF